MSYPVDEPTPLEERMKHYKPGQVTWPEPKLRKRCRQCHHFVPQKGSAEDLGYCHRAARRSPKGKTIWAAPFPAGSIACSVFKVPE